MEGQGLREEGTAEGGRDKGEGGIEGREEGTVEGGREGGRDELTGRKRWMLMNRMT